MASVVASTLCTAADATKKDRSPDGSPNGQERPIHSGEPAVPSRSPSDGHLEEPDDAPALKTQGPPRKSISHRPIYGRNGFLSVQVNIGPNGANIIGDAANEPSIAVDPNNPNRIAIGWRQFDTINSNFRQSGVGYSQDGGQSWTFPGVLEPNEFSSDPVLDFDLDGNFYYYALQPSRGPGSWACYLYKSFDGGVTWPQEIYGFGGDKAWMTVDRTGGIGSGNVYIAWSPFAGCCGGDLLTRTTDGGLTFLEPLRIPSSPRWGTLTVGPDGALYVAGVNSGGGFAVVKSFDAQDPDVVPTLESAVLVDLDGFLNFGGGPNPGGLLGQVWIASDHSVGPRRGYVYLLCSVSRLSVNDPLDVMFSRSVDGGQTWSQPVRVNDDAQDNGAYQWFGTMSIAPNGRIDVIWNDTRNDPQVVFSELYYSFSTDGGETWSENVAVSLPFNHFLGYPQQSKLGDYYDAVSDNRGVNIAYAATFNDEQDVYFLRINRFNADSDGDADLIDYSAFQACFTGDVSSPDYVPPSEECLLFDFDDQNDIDVVDFGGFQELFTGDCGVTITQHPVDVSVCLGGAVLFEVMADGEDLTYQWRHNGINIPGATERVFVVDPVAPNSAGAYSVAVFSGCAAAGSEVATLSVLEGPEIVDQPELFKTCPGESAQFSVIADGVAPISYQWLFNGQQIPGADESTYLIEAATPEDLGEYRCEVTDGCDRSVVSESAHLLFHAPVEIVDQPIGGDYCVGDQIVMLVIAGGATSFQWYKDEVTIEGATDFFLIIDSADIDDSGTYRVDVFGECDAATSDDAVVNVIACEP